MVLETVQRVAILAVLAVVVGLVWYYEGRGRWRARLTSRFVYGVPWGSLVTILLVLAVYLFVQSGIESWSDPAVTPFRSWSYSYVLGMLAAGFTHAGPGHIIGNLLAAAVLSPLVEYAWGHYPPADDPDPHPKPGAAYEHPPPGPPSEPPVEAAGRDDMGGESVEAAGRDDVGGESVEAAGRDDVGGESADASTDAASTDGTQSRLVALYSRPLVRAFVVFPVAVVAVSLLTSVFARGWSLGYSGTVFFLLGCAVVVLPLATVVSMVVLSATNVVFSALQTPILQVTTGSGAPSPPSWAGINVQAHLLGFLLGVLLALALVRHRDRWPDAERLALAVGLVVLVRGLWAYSTSSGNTFIRWQGIGVVFVLFLTAIVVSLVTVENERLVDPVQVRNLVLGPVTLRSVVVAGLAAVTLLVALSSVPPNIVGMDDDPVPDNPAIEIRDYTVTYAEDTPHGRVPGNSSGVIVVSERRQVWTSAVDERRLAHRGEATATVGGVGWREVVDVTRRGWQVAGNDTVYRVTLEHDNRTVDAFQSQSSRADARLAGHNLSVAVVPGGFRLNVTRDGERVGSTGLPEANGTATVALADPATIDELTVVTAERDGTVRLFVEREDTRILVATEERY